MPAPSTCAKENWPPDYDAVYAWRRIQLARFETNPRLLASAKAYYRTHPKEFINHWVETYDPRNAGTKKPTRMPLIMFPRQAEMVDFVYGCLKDDANGLEEKCRDMGATWVCCAISVHLLLFWEGAAVGWGSRKAELVDKRGDPKCIFEKLRDIIKNLPACFLPRGFDPRMHMVHMSVLNPENGSSIIGEVGDNIGRGGRTRVYFKDEAQPLDAKIMTPSGWKTMGDMAVGSIVSGPDGKPRRVTRINDAGEHDVYRVRFCDGSETRCSENHLWSVEKFYGARKSLTLRTSEIAASFDYVSPQGQRHYTYRTPVCSPVEFEESGSIFPLHPYVVGALLGDGSVKDVPKSCPTLTSADPELITEVARLLPAGCVMRCDGDMGYRLVDERPLSECNRWSKSRARQAVVDAGIAGKGAVEKFVPTAYLHASAADRLAVLQGLMDTDGSAANGGFPTFHTSSRRLAEDVKFLIQSLGGKAPSAVKPDHRGYLDQHIVYVMLPEGVCPFRLSRKCAALKARKRVFKRTIVGIEKCGREPVRCITVDAPDGLYLTDDFIVTHNSSHYERPENIEAALSENTRTQIDISSVNGPNNVFHRKREAGEEWAPGKQIPRGTTRVFVLDVFDHPEKTQEWFDMREKEMTNQGLGHLFAQEVKRDYLAAVNGVIIPADWVRSCVDAHIKLKLDIGDNWSAALDVADDSLTGDRNALLIKQGIVLRSADEWGGVDPGVTANRAKDICEVLSPIDVQYDCIGVGAGVKSETNRLIREKKMPRGVRFIQWNAAMKPLHPERRLVEGDKQSPKNEDYFANLKAQGWYELMMRAYRTHMAVTKGQKFDPDSLFSIDSKMRLFHTVLKELSQPIRDTNPAGKMIVDKTPEGTKSPNVGDGVMMLYFPMPAPMVISPEALNASRRR